MYKVTSIVLYSVSVAFLPFAFASAGDKNQYFQNCARNCIVDDCNNDGTFQDKTRERLVDYLFYWNCNDECGYKCMFKTVNGYMQRNWNIPQFYGKWPFTRILGLQEPASVAFSLLNLYLHYSSIIKFRKSVRPDAPLYWLWHLFAIICINAWFWSAVYHARDTETTEILDYIFAYSMVFISMYCAIIRILYSRSRIVKILVSAFSALFFLQHSTYLYYGKFDYNYNMFANICTGIIGGTSWLIWCFVQRKRRKYVWKCALFVILLFSSLVLEVNDFPPIFWIFDAHALWHLSSAPLTVLFYSFTMDDCKNLRDEYINNYDLKRFL